MIFKSLAVVLGWSSSLAMAGPQMFDADWRFVRGDPKGAQAPAFDDRGWEQLDLPHDWSIAGPIARDNPSGSPGGFFPTGIGWYRKTFVVPADWTGKTVAIRFDGVYMASDCWINNQKLGAKLYGFSPFSYDVTAHLKVGEANTIAVRVDNSRQPNARWYTGSGINRHVWLDVREPVHVVEHGMVVRTESITGNIAKLSMSVTIRRDHPSTAESAQVAAVVYEADPAGKPTGEPVARFAPVTGAFTLQPETRAYQFTVETNTSLAEAKLWSPESPSLYVAVTTVTLDGKVVDTRETVFGVRTIAVSPERGFELNDKPIELYGACVHDDNGPLGTAAFDRAEIRRAEQLKAAGFNAVRCAHNIPAPAFLDACDRLGLLVINEVFDSWTFGKNKEDYARHFEAHWKEDLDAMILRDRNHPSIIMWSLGNEIHDFGSPEGLATGTKLIERTKALDPTRPATTAVYWFRGIGGERHWKWEDADALMSKFDVVGYNYYINRYEADHQRAPGRVMVGSESYPRDLFVSWEQSTKHPYVLGDFVWTGIDYLGESGIGRFHKPDEPIHFHLDPRHYPYHGAYCGDIDLTGSRKPISHFRNIVWDRGEKLYTSVTDLTPDGRKYRVGDWGIIPSRASWTWPGFEGKSMEVQVYSRYDAVRLYLNDVLVGEKPTTRQQEFKAVFNVPYASGTLRTVGIRAGQESDRNELRTTGEPAGLLLTADRTEMAADGQDLAYLTVEAIDAKGNVHPNATPLAAFEVEGEGQIAGVSSGDYGDTRGYQGSSKQLFQGRAQVIIRSKRLPGKIIVRAKADGLAPSEIELNSR